MKAVIVEDEVLAARNLKTILESLGTVQVIATIESIAETIEWFSCNPQPEVLFLDIHLADGSAFEIFERMAVKCPVIFTTAYDEYALKAFKVNSIDYLLKPIETGDVQRALKKMKDLASSDEMRTAVDRLMASFRQATAYKTHFLIPAKGDKLIPLQANEIAFIFIDAGIVKGQTFEEKSFRFENTLDELSEMLDPHDFFRANRQYIISRKAIRDIDFWFNSRLSVNLKVTVPEKILISKARIPEFKDWFSGN
ncbi:MAG: LytTR family DNA-binding domain-containing protein [Bacteroidales bacterium]|nr:LytTR family DNA-binding domain-containing protein [Bacteroidales bacterium]